MRLGVCRYRWVPWGRMGGGDTAIVSKLLPCTVAYVLYYIFLVTDVVITLSVNLRNHPMYSLYIYHLISQGET